MQAEVAAEEQRREPQAVLAAQAVVAMEQLAQITMA
jgi:hypothetical protein